MSGREWKPGDVAMVAFNDNPAQRAVRSGGVWAFLDSSGYGIDSYVTDARPLVVIDPEDREQIKRLGDAFCLARWDHTPGSSECDPLTFTSMQAALREFANPTPPKPDAPTGLGAVVEDAEGRRWVRTENVPCWYATGYGVEFWEQITAVRVLSEGVTP